MVEEFRVESLDFVIKLKKKLGKAAKLSSKSLFFN